MLQCGGGGKRLDSPRPATATVSWHFSLSGGALGVFPQGLPLQHRQTTSTGVRGWCKAVPSPHAMPPWRWEMRSLCEAGATRAGVLYLHLTVRSACLKSHLCFLYRSWQNSSSTLCTVRGKVLILLYLNRILKRKTNLMLVVCFFLFWLLCLSFCTQYTIFDPCEVQT